MALINKLPTVLPETPSMDGIVDKIKRANTDMYSILKIRHTMVYNLIWNNPHYTPSEMLSAFGTEGASLFAVSSLVQRILAEVDPEYVRLDPSVEYDILFSEDGSVTAIKREAA